MNVRFESEIDIYFLKMVMKHISILPLESINPMVGDLVQIYHDSEIKLYMKVKSRKWEMINATPTSLIVTLTCTDDYSEDSFLSFLSLHGFPI